MEKEAVSNTSPITISCASRTASETLEDSNRYELNCDRKKTVRIKRKNDKKSKREYTKKENRSRNDDVFDGTSGVLLHEDEYSSEEDEDFVDKTEEIKGESKKDLRRERREPEIEETVPEPVADKIVDVIGVTEVITVPANADQETVSYSAEIYNYFSSFWGTPSKKE